MSSGKTTTYKASLRMTKTASEKMRGFGISERSFFMADRSYKVFIERYPASADGSLSAAFILGGAETDQLTENEQEGSMVLHCVVANHRLLVTNVTMRKSYQALGTNWQREESIAFDNSREPVSVALLNLINRMTPAKERSDYVKKRISSWEGYLQIQERGMDIPDIKTAYSKLTFSHDFSRISLSSCQLNDKEWKMLKGLSVRLSGIDGDVGTVMKAANRIVEVELNTYIVKQLREKGHALHKREVVFSNFAALSQIRRLRQGFTNLEKGLAVNPQLDRLLFEEQPTVAPLKETGKLDFHNRLNEFQQRAVTGAIAAEDLYVIQGPPGTGKTTVISEICLQNAKKGLRTLVASQSNLAVDNALGRLLAHKDIRILRVGRTESIEEEGKKFIEENVGQYWKDHTLHEITLQVETRKKRETELATEFKKTERAYEALRPVFDRLTEAVKTKKAAGNQYHEISQLLESGQNKLQGVEILKEQAVREKLDLTESLETLEKAINELQVTVGSDRNLEWLEGEEQRIEEVIRQLERARMFKRLEEQLAERKRELAAIAAKRQETNAVIDAKENALDHVGTLKKIDDLMRVMAEQDIEEGPAISFPISQLDLIHEKMTVRTKLAEYNKRTTAAISHVEGLLAPSGIAFAELKERALTTQESFTSKDIDQFLEKLRAFLKNTKQVEPAVLSNALTGLYKRQSDLWRRGALLKTPEQYAEDSKKAFGQMKQALRAELLKQQQRYVELNAKWLEELEEKQQELLLLEQQASAVTVDFDVPADIEAAIEGQKGELTARQRERTAYEQAIQHLDKRLAEQTQRLKELEPINDRINERNEEKRLLEKQLTARKQELSSLQEILASDPEAEYEKTAKEIASLSFTLESLKTEQKDLPLLQSIQKKWLDLLREANDHDLDEIRKLYIKHANVIGTTCVASARKDFVDNYPEFDVVIIDEVSKATPPELLLPMLKGKKVILVGDHHQLPPLLGNDTLEETLEEMINENSGFEEKRELEKLLEESLFERLYKNLPETNKTMLAIQYRMHADIMETISPFYQHENKQLQCGLADSDRDRDHYLEAATVKRNNHLMWLDLPNEPAYFEERMSGGKSLYNPAELGEISRLLVELNDAVAEAKKAGRIGKNELKSVGVISFYGEQVKRLQRMIDQELRLPHLTIRTGTVDRFQGSEMEIILLSMVRNNRNQHGDIGFARDYRRLNVALSRAKQLLVLIGSSDMFTKRAKKDETKKMYQHVFDIVKKKNGVKVLEGSRG